MLIADRRRAPPHCDVLLNLGDECPPFFARFERLLEIVGADEAEQGRAARALPFYHERGYEIQRNHDVDGAGR